MTSITLGGNTYNLVSFPFYLGLAEIELGMSDGVAVVPSPYVPSQVQTQVWPGADAWDLMLSPPPLPDAQAADFEGFLAELRGMLNVFQVGDPRRKHPLGVARAGSAGPEVAAGNTLYSTQLLTSGWIANTARQLLRGDMLQVGYRLHRVCETASSDASGNMTLSVWPVLREVPTTGEPVVLNKPVGVFRLAQNRRAVSARREHISTLSFRAVEVR